jgi:hypothetical protein
MVRLMCAPPEENLRPNASNAGEAEGKPIEERPLSMVTSSLSTSRSGQASRLQFGYARIRNAMCGLVNLILVISFIDVVVDPAGARSLVVLPRVQDLLFFAKLLFVAAMVAVARVGR